MNHFLIGLCCVMKSGFYMTTSDDQLSGWTKKKPQSTSQSQTCTKNQTKQILVIVWWSAANLIHCNFLNSGNTITSKKYDQEIGDATKTAKLQPAVVNRKGPILQNNTPMQSITNASKDEVGYENLSHSPYSHNLLPTDYHFFKHLDNSLQRNPFTIDRMQKKFS